MSGFRQHSGGSGYKLPPEDYQHNGRMYDDDHYTNKNEPDDGYEASHGFEKDQRGQQRGGYLASETSGFHIRGRASSPSRHGRHAYRDRDRAGYVSPRQDRRSRSRDRYNGRSRSYSRDRRPRTPDYGGPLCKEIMLDGLPSEIAEEDIVSQLKTHYNVRELKDVRIIRDRETKKAKGFGFVRFHRIEDAETFMNQNYPIIHLEVHSNDGQRGESSKVRLAFSREKEDRRREEDVDDDWICASCSFRNFAGRKSCHRCHALPIVMPEYPDAQAQQQEYLQSGDSDAAMQGPPSQFLLIRGLEANVTEELLSKGVTKLLKPSPGSQATPAPGGRKSKVASTTGDANLGAKEGSIKRVFVVRDRTTDGCWRYGFAEFSNPDEASAAITRFNSFDRFTISSKPVTVSFIHTGVFVPVTEGQDDPRYCFTPLTNPNLQLRYWNDRAYVKELIVSPPDEDPFSAIVELPQTIADAAITAATREGIISVSDEGDAKSKKRKGDTKEKDQGKIKKSTPAHLQFWSNRHAELHRLKPDSGTSTGDVSHAMAAGGIKSEDTDKSFSAPPTMSFADPSKNCCYLCSRQFKSTAEVNRHERLSKLHQDNLQNDELRRKATAKLEKVGLSTNVVADNVTNDYRDRAKERRQAFGPTKKISLPMKKQDTSDLDSSVLNAHAEISTNAKGSSKGAALLGKMGWSSGEGLGARGEGVTEAIATNVYAAGVGLGAEGSKLGDAAEEAARNSRGDYKEFLQKTKEKAKQRYESM